ncbi:hypothetical protein D3C71_945650 [compost metagenome]
MGGGGFVEQTLIDAFLFPIPCLEMRAEDAQIDQGKLTPDQARQQRRKTFADNNGQVLANRSQDRRFHQCQRHRSRDTENLPFVGQVVAAVGVARIDAHLLLAA